MNALTVPELDQAHAELTARPSLADANTALDIFAELRQRARDARAFRATWTPCLECGEWVAAGTDLCGACLSRVRDQ